MVISVTMGAHAPVHSAQAIAGMAVSDGIVIVVDVVVGLTVHVERMLKHAVQAPPEAPLRSPGCHDPSPSAKRGAVAAIRMAHPASALRR